MLANSIVFDDCISKNTNLLQCHQSRQNTETIVKPNILCSVANALHDVQKEASILSIIKELRSWQFLWTIISLNHLKINKHSYFTTTNDVVLITKEMRLANSENLSRA